MNRSSGSDWLTRFKDWNRSDKLALGNGVIAVVIAIVGIAVTVILTRGSSPAAGGSAAVGAHGGTAAPIAESSTIWGSPDLDGPTAPSQADSCPVLRASDRRPVAVDLLVHPYQRNQCWERSTTLAETPSEAELEIKYTNTSEVVQQNVVFFVRLPSELHLVPGTTYLMNSIYPNGHFIDVDSIATNGVVLDSYEPRATGYVAFEVDTPAIGDLHCGTNVLRVTAYVQPKGLKYFYNSADVDLHRTC